MNILFYLSLSISSIKLHEIKSKENEEDDISETGNKWFHP